MALCHYLRLGESIQVGEATITLAVIDARRRVRLDIAAPASVPINYRGKRSAGPPKEEDEPDDKDATPLVEGDDPDTQDFNVKEWP